MQIYAQTFFAAPGRPLIPPPGSAFTNVNLVYQQPPPKILPLENLRGYLRAARVVRPKLAKGHPPVCATREQRITPPEQFLLSIEPDSRFRLRMLGTLVQGVMDKEIKNFMDKYVSEDALIEVENAETHIRTANFNTPAPGFLIYAKTLPLINNAMTLAQHTLQLLETSERILNVVWPQQSRGHTFVIPKEFNVIPGADAEICTPIYYTKVRERDLVDFNEPMVKMVVLVLPPWVFAGADLYEFVNMCNFPEYKMNHDGTLPTFTRAEKLLAQVYDCCIAKNCPFFAVTTFTNWIFGAFNPASGWSKVILSPNISYSDFQPTILEWVTFWTASALQVPEAFSPSNYPYSGIPELDNMSNLQKTAERNHPSRTLSDEDWLKTYLDTTPEDTVTHTTTQISENTWVTEIH